MRPRFREGPRWVGLRSAEAVRADFADRTFARVGVVEENTVSVAGRGAGVISMPAQRSEPGRPAGLGVGKSRHHETAQRRQDANTCLARFLMAAGACAFHDECRFHVTSTSQISCGGPRACAKINREPDEGVPRVPVEY